MERVWALKILKTGHILCCKIFPSLHSMALSALFSVSPASGEGAPDPQKEKEEELRESTEQEIPTPPVYTTHSLVTFADWLTRRSCRESGRKGGWLGKVPHSMSKQANAKIVTSSFCCLLNDVNTNSYTFHCFQEQKCIQICGGTLYLTKSRQI